MEVLEWLCLTFCSSCRVPAECLQLVLTVSPACTSQMLCVCQVRQHVISASPFPGHTPCWPMTTLRWRCMMQSSVVVALGQYETSKFGMLTVREILYIVYFCIFGAVWNTQVWHVDSSQDSVYCMFLRISIFMVLGCNYTWIYIVVMETSDIITIPTTWTSIIIVLQGNVHPDFVQKAKGLTLGFNMPHALYTP